MDSMIDSRIAGNSLDGSLTALGEAPVKIRIHNGEVFQTSTDKTYVCDGMLDAYLDATHASRSSIRGRIAPMVGYCGNAQTCTHAEPTANGAISNIWKEVCRDRRDRELDQNDRVSGYYPEAILAEAGRRTEHEANEANSGRKALPSFEADLLSDEACYTIAHKRTLNQLDQLTDWTVYSEEAELVEADDEAESFMREAEARGLGLDAEAIELLKSF